MAPAASSRVRSAGACANTPGVDDPWRWTDVSKLTVEERFWSHVDKNGPIPAHRPDLGPCWPWTGGRDKKGYGHFGFEGENKRAHVVALILTTGGRPEGAHGLHHCDNPPCCNPAHLFWGSNDDNVADSIAKGRANACRTNCPAGHEYTPENTRLDKKGHRFCRECHRIASRNRRANPRPMAADDPRHGHVNGYIAGCRQPCCMDASAAYARKRRAIRSGRAS